MEDLPSQAVQIGPALAAVLSAGVGGVAGWLAVVFRMGKYQEKVDHLVCEKDRANNKMEAMRSDVDKLLEFKSTAQKFIDSKIYQAQSKLQLTDYGKDLVEKSGFKIIFDKEKTRLASLLKQKDPKTQYDVQEMARSLLDSMSDDPAFIPIKTYAFNSGKDIGQILRAGGILLRDYYLEIHPDIIA